MGMKTFSALFLLAVVLSGCIAAFRAASAVALGRQELFRGQNADALESFEVAARERREKGDMLTSWTNSLERGRRGGRFPQS